MNQLIEIQHYLPHQKPMLMVDLIVFINHEKVETTFRVEEDNVFTDDDHLAEAGLIENAAQTCSAIVAKSYLINEEGEERDDIALVGFISTLKTINIYGLPKIGSEITTKANLISRFDTDSYTTCMMDCKVFCGQELLLEGKINLFIQEQAYEKGRSTAG